MGWTYAKRPAWSAHSWGPVGGLQAGAGGPGDNGSLPLWRMGCDFKCLDSTSRHRFRDWGAGRLNREEAELRGRL